MGQICEPDCNRPRYLARSLTCPGYGADPQRERKVKRVEAASVLTFGILAQRYIDEYAGPRKASWKNDEGHLKRPRARWAQKPAKAVFHRDVIEFLDYGTIDEVTCSGEQQRQAESIDDDMRGNRGGGTVVIDGDPTAQAEATCMIRNTRPGVDGSYRIHVVEHRPDRSGSYVTTLELREPSVEEDDRELGAPSGGSTGNLPNLT
jgi:hypothetical protein